MNKQTSTKLMEKINQIVMFLHLEDRKLRSERFWLQRVLDAKNSPETAKPESFNLSDLEALIILLFLFYFIAFFVMIVEIFYHKYKRYFFTWLHLL